MRDVRRPTTRRGDSGALAPARHARPVLALGALLAGLTLVSCSGVPESEEAGATESIPDHPEQVTLTRTALEAGGIRVAEPTALNPLDVGDTLEVPGTVTFDSSRIAVVSPRAAGRLESMTAPPGTRVTSTDTVALVSSPEYLAAQIEFVQARRRVELLEGTDDVDGARAVLDATRQRLLLLGATADDIDALVRGDEPSLNLPLRPPFSGTVIQALAEPGVALSPGTPVYRIASLEGMHIVAQVAETALRRIAPGQIAWVSVRAYPGRTFQGRVIRILEQLDPETRTARIVLGVSNDGRILKDGMFATVRIEAAPQPGDGDETSAAGSSRGAFTLPMRAVLADGERRFVFVEVGVRTFERRDVRVAPQGAGEAPTDRVIVISGLSEGDRVVVEGAMVLRSELARATLVDDDG